MPRIPWLRASIYCSRSRNNIKIGLLSATKMLHVNSQYRFSTHLNIRAGWHPLPFRLRGSKLQLVAIDLFRFLISIQVSRLEHLSTKTLQFPVTISVVYVL